MMPSMKISQLYKTQKHTFSFEFFPPKSAEGEKKLLETVRQLKPLAPSFISVTYGAMGGTRTGTVGTVERVKKEAGFEAAAHLTCIAHTKEEIADILGELVKKGIENIVALRGDILPGAEFKPIPNGFRHGSDLVRFIRTHPVFRDKFALAVAGYPETHIECRDKVKDLEHLKEKVDAGADVVITQLFFSNRDYFDFVKRARKIGIQLPIVPGIMPVSNGAQIQKFAKICGAGIPPEMQKKIDEFGEDQASVEQYGIEFATRQCKELLENGVPGIHFYTLNKSRATREIYANLNLAPTKVKL